MEEIEYELIHLENISIERERGSNTDMGLFIRCLAKKNTPLNDMYWREKTILSVMVNLSIYRVLSDLSL